MHATYKLKWNISYQRQIGKDWRASINYLGHQDQPHPGRARNQRGAELSAGRDHVQHQPAPHHLPAESGAGPVLQLDRADRRRQHAHYNGLLLSLEHRFANHFTWLVNYTWSHCISTYDFGGELAGNNYQDPNNRRAECGNCNFDRRHIFNTSLVAISPGIGSGVAKRITGGLAGVADHHALIPASPTTRRPMAAPTSR